MSNHILKNNILKNSPWKLKGIKELTFKFSGCAAGLFGDSSRFPWVDPLSVDSIEGHNRVSGKGFPTTGPRIEAGNVVVHRGLHVTRPLVAACVLSDWNCMSMDLEVTVRYVVVIGLDIDHGVWMGKDNGLVWTEGTRLICASFGITRLIGASFGITRLIGVSFGITRLICAFYGTTRLLCRVRAQRGADRRGAGRMREGHMDASGFLIASADSQSFRFCRLTYNVSLCFVSLWLKRSLPLVREIPPRRGARRGGRGGRGRGAGRVQPEVQLVAQATDPAAPVTHADLAAMEQRFRDLIMQMREQQQPVPPAPAPVPAPAPAPVPVSPHVVPDQLSAEAKHLRDFRKYNPTTFDGSLEDPTRAQLWLSSLETIFDT
ncbi:gag protease polyprotein [Cucumis melo var. makuwa]|uniref:Gag protease polyprotein n=1 Tax=Cucumis melo var. makuwa TaxID=1194695 RepID=A0A5A7VJS0_CUCMM|nr:gag protease polyprotein [Cucumis melo var. makuwa]